MPLDEDDGLGELDPALSITELIGRQRPGLDPFVNRPEIDAQVLGNLLRGDEGFVVGGEVGNTTPTSALGAPIVG